MALPVSVVPFCQLIGVFAVAFINLLLLLLGKRRSWLQWQQLIFLNELWRCHPGNVSDTEAWEASSRSAACVRGWRWSCCSAEPWEGTSLLPRAGGWHAGCSASLWPGLPEVIGYPHRACAPHVMTSGRVCALGEEVTWLSFPPFWGSRKSLCSDDFGDGNRSWPHLMGELLGSSSPPWQVHVNWALEVCSFSVELAG